MFAEGASETAAIDDIRAHLRLPQRLVHLAPNQGDPSAVVRAAKAFHRRNQREYRASRVVVAFDRDDHEHWAAALTQAEALGFLVAASNPCFELWGILLHEEQRAHVERGAMQRRLRQIHPGYDHSRHPYLDQETVIGGFEIAGERARELARIATELEEPWRNPVTRFHLAVDLVLSIMR